MIQKYVTDLDLAEGDTVRGDCPDCGGKNTFTANKSEGAVLYNCYKLGCKIRGVQTVGMTAADIQARLHNIPKPKPKIEAMVIPPHVVFTNGSGLLEDFKYTWDLHDQGLLFDLKDSRAVFPIYSKGVLIDAIGRALKGANPKWLRYTGKANYFTAGIGKTVVIVEDVISAITVAKLGFTGMAILGTSLSDAHMSHLGEYQRIIVALDPDAAHKTLKYRQEVEAWTDIRTIALRLDDDIKYRIQSDIDKLKEYL